MHLLCMRWEHQRFNSVGGSGVFEFSKVRVVEFAMAYYFKTLSSGTIDCKHVSAIRRVERIIRESDVFPEIVPIN